MADYIMNDDRDAKDILIELRESTGMNRHQFCEYFEIPYMTVSDWEHGKKRVPSSMLSPYFSIILAKKSQQRLKSPCCCLVILIIFSSVFSN